MAKKSDKLSVSGADANLDNSSVSASPAIGFGAWIYTLLGEQLWDIYQAILNNGGGTSPTTYVGQGLIGTNPFQLPQASLSNGVIIKAKQSNTGVLFVGNENVNTVFNGSGTGYPLAAGESISIAASDGNIVFVAGTAGDIFSYIGS